MDWWWKELTNSRSPSSLRSKESGSVVMLCERSERGACCECLMSVRSDSADCWSWNKRPPKATVSTCMPRQMPNKGICQS